jgi:hypothetical protein
VRSALVSGAAFGAAGRTTMILWSDEDTAATVAAPPGQDAIAAPPAATGCRGGAGGLRLDQEPVLLSIPAAPDRALRLIG